jgi:hypothetical protein
MSGDIDEFPKRQRKGLYEELLCEQCEKQVCTYEDFAAKVLNGGVGIGIQSFPDKIIASDIQYDKFKLFQLSILWRSGVSRRPEFNNIKLGPHQELLRKMILNNNPGESYEYGCLMSFVPDANERLQRMVYPLEPLNRKIKSFQIYRGIFGGLIWAYVVSSHNKSFPCQEVFLSKNGVLIIFSTLPTAKEFIFDDIDKIMSNDIEKIKRRTV